MGNYQKKKQAAVIHNTSMEISKNLLYIGECECKGNLFMYLSSQEENMFKIYCTSCEKVLDFRKIDEYENLKLFFSIRDIISTLEKSYGPELMEKINEN
jgi:hypothetical protein